MSYKIYIAALEFLLGLLSIVLAVSTPLTLNWLVTSVIWFAAAGLNLYTAITER